MFPVNLLSRHESCADCTCLHSGTLKQTFQHFESAFFPDISQSIDSLLRTFKLTHGSGLSWLSLTFILTHSVVLSFHPSAVSHCDLLKLNVFAASLLWMFDFLMTPLLVLVGSCSLLVYRVLM